MVPKEQPADERLHVTMTRKLIHRIDEYRWRARVDSRAAAIRALVELGLQHVESRGKTSKTSD
jgi:metal-responsive CopG/Arc/MetJ family transcriptional regulator